MTTPVADENGVFNIEPDAVIGDAVAVATVSGASRYEITGGNASRLFAIDAEGIITLAVPKTQTDPDTHTLTVVGTDSADNSLPPITVKIYDDTIRGTHNGEGIGGTLGADTIYGYCGDDFLNGGEGADMIYGGSGADMLVGAKGNDMLYGGNGADMLIGGKSNDTLDGGSGDDELRAGNGKDTLDGGSGDDDLHGGNGKDTLFGGIGEDTLTGGDDADIFVLNTDNDSGVDTVTDFTPSDGDKIRVYVDVDDISTINTLKKLYRKAELRVKQEGDDTLIYKKVGLADTQSNGETDDVLLMKLKGFSKNDLRIGMFDVRAADDAEEPSIIGEIDIKFSEGVPENTDASTSLVVAEVSSVGTGVTYRIIEGNDCGLFAIDDNGKITLAGALDYEAEPSHILTVEARNSDDATDTDEITIDVDNVEEGKATVKIMINGEDEADVDLVSVGDTLTVDFDIEDPDGLDPDETVSYYWFHNDSLGLPIHDGSNEYTVSEDDIGEIIGVTVRYTDNTDDRTNVMEVMYLTVGTRLIRPPEDEIDNDNVLMPLSPDESSQIEGGDGSDTITDGTGNDIIDGGLGDDTIDLGADASGSDSDTVIYGIGDQTAQDGGDGVANFKRGQDKFIFSLKSDLDGVSAIQDMDGFLNFITKGTDDLSDDEFWVLFSIKTPANPATQKAEVDGIYLHFNDSVFYSGGRVSMPIVKIQFSENLDTREKIEEIFDGDIAANVKRGILTNLDYLNDVLGGDDDFDAIGYRIVEPDMV